MMLLTHPADAEGTGALPWQESFTARLEALALLQTLNAELLSHDSATLTLDRWCAAHRLASPARIVADRAAGAEQAPTDEQRQLFGVSATEPVRYRRVRLICGDHVLSVADNWYVPARLTPEMNRQLDTTDIAFGRAVQALNFRRHTLSAKLLWPPLPQDWEMSAPLPERKGATLTIPHAVLQHCAVLSLPDGTPFSEVVETYTRESACLPGAATALAHPQWPIEQGEDRNERIQNPQRGSYAVNGDHNALVSAGSNPGAGRVRVLSS